VSFVTSLREKLAKPDLRILLQSIKSYRDDGDSVLLFKTLKTYLVRKIFFTLTPLRPS